MKKTICMLLTALMILGLAACGSEKQEAEAESTWHTETHVCRLTARRCNSYDNGSSKLHPLKHLPRKI